MKPVVFHRDAEAEIAAAADYYDLRILGLGNEFIDVIHNAVILIAAMPEAFRPYGDEGFRRFVLRRFPYTIYYLELETVIWIAAVGHHRRKPRYWEHRKSEQP